MVSVTSRLSASVALSAALLACGPPAPPTIKPPELTPERKIRMAESMLRNGQASEAFRLLDEAVAEDPKNAAMRNYYGQLAFRAGRFDQAEEAYEKALELDPYLTDVQNNLGALYASTGRPQDAEAAFQKVLADPSYPNPEKAWFNLGLLYGSQGRDDEAIQSLRRAVEISPKYYQAQYELASVLDRTGHLEEAARLYEVAAPDYKGSGEYQYRLGFVYFRLHEADKAREHLNRVLDVAPGSESSAKAADLLKLLPHDGV